MRRNALFVKYLALLPAGGAKDLTSLITFFAVVSA